MRTAGGPLKAAILLNPTASRADGGREVARRLADRLGAPYLEAGEPTDPRRLAREAVDLGIRRLVVAGGDGTLNLVVNGLGAAMDRVELAVLPLGTGNDLARSLDVPLDPERAARLAEEGRAVPMDVGRISGRVERYFLNAVVGGIGGIISRDLTTERKRRWGGLSYGIQALGELRRLRRYDVRVRLEGGEEREGDSYCVIGANGRRVGGGIPVAPGAWLDDGELDVLVFPASSALDTGRLLLAALRGTHQADPEVWSRRARAGSISSSPGMWFDVDGEVVGSDPLHFEVLPRALRVVAGSGAALRRSRPRG